MYMSIIYVAHLGIKFMCKNKSFCKLEADYYGVMNWEEIHSS